MLAEGKTLLVSTELATPSFLQVVGWKHNRANDDDGDEEVGDEEGEEGERDEEWDGDDCCSTLLEKERKNEKEDRSMMDDLDLSLFLGIGKLRPGWRGTPLLADLHSHNLLCCRIDLYCTCILENPPLALKTVA